jgi:sugar lactone lactonase YvrE
MAVAPDGRRLYAVDRAVRRLVEVDTDALTITRTVDIPFSAAPTVPISLVVARDGRLYVSDGPTIIAVRTDSLAVVGRRQAQGPVSALVVAGDGRGLFASSPHHVEVFDAVTRTSTPVPDDAVAISHILA